MAERLGTLEKTVSSPKSETEAPILELRGSSDHFRPKRLMTPPAPDFGSATCDRLIDRKRPEKTHQTNAPRRIRRATVHCHMPARSHAKFWWLGADGAPLPSDNRATRHVADDTAHGRACNVRDHKRGSIADAMPQTTRRCRQDEHHAPVEISQANDLSGCTCAHAKHLCGT